VKSFPNAKYVEADIPQGSALAKEHAVRAATGQYKLVLDSHVLLDTGVLERVLKFWRENPEDLNLYQGPNLHGWLRNTAGEPALVGTHFAAKWGGDGMFGEWRVAESAKDPESKPFDIELGGTGLFMFKSSGWLGFNTDMRGFGAEEGYLHEKYRCAGRKAMLLPWLRWIHRYGHIGGAGYNTGWWDRCRNYLLSFKELGYPAFDGIKKAHVKEGRLSEEQFAKLVAELGVDPSAPRKLFASGVAKPPPPRVPAPNPESMLCEHRGPVIRKTECDLCGLKGKPMFVHECKLYGECSIQRQHSQIRGCVACMAAGENTEAVAQGAAQGAAA
jgi:hypothetical protein